MSPKTKQLLTALSPLFAFTLAAFGLSALLGLRGADAWILRGGLVVLGAASSGLTWWFTKSARGASAPAADGAAAAAPGRDIDTAFGAARERLAASRPGGKASLSTLPAIIVIGPASSAKTTSVVRSGLEAELLAGGVMAGDAVAPTSGVNLWFGQDAVIIEAGGPLLSQTGMWGRLLHHLRPSRIATLFRGRAQPPRAAVVCIGCDRLLEPGGAEATLTAARVMRERLGELSRTLGTRLPVYVVFTKMDRIAHFAEWVRGFSREEASEVLGATLPADLGAPVGSYADRETARLSSAFERIVQSLTARRTEVLAREYAGEQRASAYEFPRELAKLARPVVDVLVEIARPSRLQVSPFLRGFYFTGVQAILVSDSAAARPQPAVARSASAGGHGARATVAFESPAGGASLPPPTLTPQGGGTRKVPRWVFLDRFFSDAVLRDAPALDSTRGGAGVDQVRRTALAAAAAVGMFLTLGLFISFIGNSRLESATVREARVVAALPPAQLDLPSAEQLGRLDELRARLETLARWSTDGAPWRLRFGLFTGSSLLAPAGRVWFDGFERTMLDETRRTLLYNVRAFPDSAQPTDDYGARYDLLKAYLLTTAHPDKSEPAFLTPVLMRHWLAGRELDAERSDLAARQFDHYGAVLPTGDPYASAADSVAVREARDYLLQFAGIEPIYRSMLADASLKHPAVVFNRQVPSAAGIVVNSYEVPGAFTRDGWTTMQAALANIDRYYQAESWVLGEAPDLPSDRARLAADLQAHYRREYVEQWREYLAKGSMGRYADLRDAARKLAEASANRSPLLGMLALAAHHTAVDSSITAMFQPVHHVAPPTLEGSYLTDGNRPYIEKLIELQSAVNQTVMMTVGMQDQAAAQATNAAAGARVAARTLAQGFSADADAEVGAAVLRLLEEPIMRVEPWLRTAGTGELNPRGQRFCAVARPLLARVPFSSRTSAQASVDEVTRFFRPGGGEVHRFYDEALSRVVDRRDGQLVQKPGVTASVAPDFVDFFERALTFSDVFFRDGSSELRLQFDLTPVTNANVPMVAIVIDGQEVVSGFNQVRRRMIWMARTAREARLEGTIGGTRTTLLSFEGPWALFQLFQAAESVTPVGDEHRFEWVFRNRGPQGETITIAATAALGGAPVLRRDFFEGFTCTGQVVR